MIKIHSEIIGKGTPLLFFPAAGFTGVEGLNIAESLAGNFECHLIDIPGMGKSEGINGIVTRKKIASWVKSYIDYYQLGKVTLVGHSMGGGIALCFATVYPEYVSRLILLDQGHIRLPRFPTKDFGRLGYVMPIISTIDRLIGDKLWLKIEKLITIEKDITLSSEELDKKVKDFCAKFNLQETNYIKKALADEIKVTWKGFRLMVGYYRLNLPELLKRLTVPCLLIYASFKDIDYKRSKKTLTAVNKIMNKTNLSLFNIDSHHYVHWSSDKCIEEIKKYIT